jgi:hypothetical protein
MPTDSKSDQPEMPGNPLRDLVRLALPLLSFQRDILEVVKKNIQDGDTVKHARKFTFHELHALMMIVDPARRFRNRFDEDFEKKLEEAFNEIVPKVATASVQLIEASQKALCVVSEGLNNLRQGEKPNKRPDGP